MTLQFLGFGVEIETAVEPIFDRNADQWKCYKKFAQVLEQNGLKAAARGQRDSINPRNYQKWWITSDGSIAASRGQSKLSRLLFDHEHIAI